MIYSGTVQSLLKKNEDHWGDPYENREKLVPYGLGVIDLALYGIDVINGEIIWLIGEEKKRKTTLLANIIVNYMTANKPKVKPGTIIDSLEPGMPPEVYKDFLLCNLASRYLLADGHKVRMRCPICNAVHCKQLLLKPKYLRFNTRTPEQQEAIERATEEMMTWPLWIFGPNPDQGDTLNLMNSRKRWINLIEEKGVQIVGIDHIQQYGRGILGDYEVQTQGVRVFSEVVGVYKVAFFVISQVSLTSVREARQGGGRITAAGGKKGAQAANVEFTVGYNNNSCYITADITASRTSEEMGVIIPIEPVSGAIMDEVKPRGKA